MTLIKWRPLRSMLSFRDEMDKLLNEVYGNFAPMSEGYGGDWLPVMDVSETENEIVASVELPGLTKEDITVSVKDDVLSVSGEKKQEKTEEKENIHRVERSYGHFRRTMVLPADVDAEKVKATYKDGILKVTLPKVESKKPKEIPIHVS